MSNKHCLSKVFLPHDIVELILEKLPVKSLLKFRSISKQWKSTIESQDFQERQVVFSQQSKYPNILLMSNFEDFHGVNLEALSTSVFKSSDLFKIPCPLKRAKYKICPSSCDGLICFHDDYYSGMVVNPTTRWYRSFPPPLHQQLILDNEDSNHVLGFGKDKTNGIYKPVWLYNSSELGLGNATACEVFDFSTNSWRYVTLSSPFRILDCLVPVYVDGSLYWFTDCKQTKLVSFDLHSETFQVMSKLPCDIKYGYAFNLCNLDNRLCISERNWPDQVVWSFDSGNETWTKMYSIDLNREFYWSHYTFSPQAVLETNKLLYSTCERKLEMYVQDPETKSTELVFISSADSVLYHPCYFESLVSIL